MTDHSDQDRDFLERRLDLICEGVKEALRREVRRLREQGLPIVVQRDGKVVVIQPEKSDKRGPASP